MFLVIIFSIQFYFLAKLFNKDKLRTILTAIGLYFGGVIIFSIVLSFLFAFKIFDSGVDFSTRNFDNMLENSVAMDKFLQENYITIAMQVILYIAIGMVYFNYLKRKWTLEMFSADIEKRKEEILQNIATNQKVKPLKLDVYPHFHTVNEKNIHLVQPLANDIWNECYKDLLSQDQINYMIDKMYNNDKINEGIANGDVWEILKIDNVPSGYLHYLVDDNNTVFLSKIYLKESNQTKGIGQLMLNRVVEYATSKGVKAVHLTVNKNNAKAIRFYEKNGFKNMESKTFDIGNGYVMDDFIYQKTI